MPLWTQAPLPGLQASVVHLSLSSHFLGVLLVHLPASQVSPSVHRSKSSHGAVLFRNTQPLAGSQPSLVQALPSLQAFFLPSHTPLMHASPLVQTSPSSHLVASLTGVLAHLLAVQVSVVQALLSSQSLALPQLPPQPTMAVNLQAPVLVSQASVVHLLPSLQILAPPATQTLPEQVSLTVQALPSASQGATLAVLAQPFFATHASVVHAF